MNLLVAAHRALLRSLSTCLWDPPAEENCGRASRRLQQNSAADTSSHPDAVCPIRRRQASVCGRFRASAWRHRAAYPHALTNHKSQIKWHIFPQHLSHAQVVLDERLTSPCAITVGYRVRCLAQPLFYIGLLGATGCSDGSKPACACVRQSMLVNISWSIAVLGWEGPGVH